MLPVSGLIRSLVCKHRLQVRTKTQGGAFPDDEQYFWQLMVTGLRFGVEYVDVEAGMSREGKA